MNMDVLAFAAHPDDVEISCCGSLMGLLDAGKKVGVIDLTRGELGSRGNAELRKQESAAASALLGLHVRENLGLADGFFSSNESSLRQIIQVIRTYKPSVVLCNAPSDRHPDHGRACALVKDACFYSGLIKIETMGADGLAQAPHRPKAVYSYVQDHYLKPDFVMDITPYMERKIEALKCYSSQFYNPQSAEPVTPISGKEFFDFLRGRAMQMGRDAGFLYAEGFIAHRALGVTNLFNLV